jgi:hypothetical protein
LQANEPLHVLPVESQESAQVADGSHATLVHPAPPPHEKLHFPFELHTGSWQLPSGELQLKPQVFPTAHAAPLQPDRLQLVPCMH